MPSIYDKTSVVFEGRSQQSLLAFLMTRRKLIGSGILRPAENTGLRLGKMDVRDLIL